MTTQQKSAGVSRANFLLSFKPKSKKNKSIVIDLKHGRKTVAYLVNDPNGSFLLRTGMTAQSWLYQYGRNDPHAAFLKSHLAQAELRGIESVVLRSAYDTVLEIPLVDFMSRAKPFHHADYQQLAAPRSAFERLEPR
jgi:hypothetical protein